jgi:hypothetical protein
MSDSHGSKGSKGSKGSEDCCNCVEGMAEKLEQFKGFYAYIYEEGNKALAQGAIRNVKDNSVLHLERVTKTVFLPGGGLFSNVFTDLYISICSITEFAPLFPVDSVSAEEITNMQNEMQKKLNETRVR